MRIGIEAYFAKINKSGGINGRQLKLVSMDDGYEPTRTVENTKKLLSGAGVFALLGYVGTPTSNAVLPLVTEGKVPFIGPFTGTKSLREPFNRHFSSIRRVRRSRKKRHNRSDAKSGSEADSLGYRGTKFIGCHRCCKNY
jgi:branched-chain amino acid transport system substrate-binding protein